MGRYTDYARMLVERPEPSRLLTFGGNLQARAEPLEKLSPEEDVVQAYLLLGYGISEEVFILHKRKWMDDET